MLTGQNGILNRAAEAKNKSEIAEEKESIRIAVLTSKIEDSGYTELNQKKLQEAINSQFGNNKAIVSDNGDCNFTISFTKSNRNYSVLSNGDVRYLSDKELTNIYVYYVNNTLSSGTLIFRNNPMEINENQGDKAYGNIKGKKYQLDFIWNPDIELNDEQKSMMTPWFEDREKITKVKFENEVVPTSIENWFLGCKNLITISKNDLMHLDTSNLTNMHGAFVYCTNLQNIDVSNFNTSNVTSMEAFLGHCESLQSIDVSMLDTSNVTSMQSMFSTCKSLKSIDVSNFNTSNVTILSSMFFDCSNLTNINLSTFITSNVTNMTAMFNGCTNLESLDLSNFDTSRVTNMSSMFNGCINLKDINLRSFNTSRVTNMSWMFQNCQNLTEIDVSNFNTSNVSAMRSMFNKCKNISNLDLRNFNTKNLTSAAYMFLGCTSLSEIKVGIDWKISEKTDTTSMFSDCGVSTVTSI